MAIKVLCREVGFDDCAFEARGTRPEVTGQLLAHVRQKHGIELSENVRDQSEAELPEPERMIWARIQTAVSKPTVGD